MTHVPPGIGMHAGDPACHRYRYGHTHMKATEGVAPLQYVISTHDDMCPLATGMLTGDPARHRYRYGHTHTPGLIRYYRGYRTIRKYNSL